MSVGVDPGWETQCRPRHMAVIEQMCPRRHRLVSRLYSSRLLNEEEEESFSKSDMSETDMAEDILRILRKQPGSYEKFCDVLLQVENGALRHLEKLLRPSRQTSIEECGSSGNGSEQRMDRKSVEFYVKKEYFQQFEQIWQRLVGAVSYRLGIPEESITSCPVSVELPPSENCYRIHVADKAIVTIIISGVEKAAIVKQVNAILNFISAFTKVTVPEVEILQILPTNSVLLVIRLPGLAMVDLIIAFFSLQIKPRFLQHFKEVLPESVSSVKFGFASLPYCSAVLHSLPAIENAEDESLDFARQQQSGKPVSSSVVSSSQSEGFNPGDQVKVTLDLELLKIMQDSHSEWNPKMEKIIGKVGTVSRVIGEGVQVKYKGLETIGMFHPAALTKVVESKVEVAESHKKCTLCDKEMVEVTFKLCNHRICCKECLKQLKKCTKCQVVKKAADCCGTWSVAQQRRLCIEKLILEKNFRSVRWHNPGRRGATHVDVEFTTNVRGRYTLRLYVPSDWPNSCPSLVIAWSSKPIRKQNKDPMPISSNEFYTHGTDHGCLRICHFRPSSWSPQNTMYLVFLKGRLWLEAFEIHLTSGHPIDRYLKHMRN